MINNAITEYRNINDFMQQKLIVKCDREKISIDEVTFLVNLEAKQFLHKPTMLYIKVSICYQGTMKFKMNIVKLVDKYPKIMTSLVTLNFLGSYYKDIKNICKENQEHFE